MTGFVTVGARVTGWRGGGQTIAEVRSADWQTLEAAGARVGGQVIVRGRGGVQHRGTVQVATPRGHDVVLSLSGLPRDLDCDIQLSR